MAEQSKMSRRAALAAAGTVGLSALGAQALGQERQPQPRPRLPADVRARLPELQRQMNECDFRVKRVTPRTGVTTAAMDAANRMQFGGKEMKLKLDTDRAYGIVKSFPLGAEKSKTLKRNENVVECVALGISDEGSRKAIQSHLAAVKAPGEMIDRAAYFFVRGARRSGTGRDVMSLAKQQKVEGDQSFILAVLEQGKKSSVLVLFPDMFKRARWVVVSGLTKTPVAGEDPEEPEKPAVEADDSAKDFAACYGDCMSTVPEWLLAVVAAICTACTATIAASLIPGAQPVSVPLLIAACAGCAVAIGIVLANCLLTCHEMLGQD